jgi:hypothetical protein
MGHKVNPNIYRLGITLDWKYQLREPLLANIYLSKLTKNLITQYSVPYNTYNVRRSQTLDDTSDETIIQSNPIYFLTNNFIFSHLCCSSDQYLRISIFLLDSKALDSNLFPITFSYLSNLSVITPSAFKSLFRYNSRYEEEPDENEDEEAELNEDDTAKIIKINNIFCSTDLPYNNQPFPLWLINNWDYFLCDSCSVNFFKNLRIFSFLLRFVKLHYKNISKKRLFFFNIFIIASLTLLLLLPPSNFTRRLVLFVNLLWFHLFSFRYLIFQYHENLVSKYFIFNFFSQVITLSLKKLHFTRKITSIRFIGLHDRNINANVLVNYIIIKLKQYILLNEIITPLLRRLKEHSNIIGLESLYQAV